MPIDGLPVYIDKTWDMIRNDKELNIPGQIEMVAHYRCNEVKEEAMTKVKPQIQELVALSSKQKVSQFNDNCNAILEEGA